MSEEQQYLDSLNPRVKQLLEETGTNLGLEDLEALSSVSVRALTQLFEDITKGITKEQAFQDMRQRAVQQLREKKVIQQERKSHWEKQAPWLKEQKEQLKNQRHKAKTETRTTLKNQLRELKDLSISEAASQNASLREAIETEQFHLEQCVENVDMLIEELETAESLLDALKGEEELLKDTKQKNEVDRALKLVNKAETAFRGASETVTRMQEEFEELMQQFEEAHQKREAVQMQKEEMSHHEEDDEDAPPPMADEDDLPPPPMDSDEEDVDALARIAEEESRLAHGTAEGAPLDDDEMEAPPPSDSDSEMDEDATAAANGANESMSYTEGSTSAAGANLTEEELIAAGATEEEIRAAMARGGTESSTYTSEDASHSQSLSEEELSHQDEIGPQAVSQESMAAIMEAMETADDEESDEDEIAPEDDEEAPEPEPSAAHSGDVPQPNQATGEDAVPERSVEDPSAKVPQPETAQEDAAPVPHAEPSLSEKKSRQPRKSIRRAVPQQRVDVSTLGTTQWMKARFDVTKFDPKKKFLSKKTRTWELDFFSSLFVNMSRKGKVKKTMKPNKLIQLEKNVSDLKRLRMQFFEASHSYELLFNSNYMRERFFESAAALRPTQYVWCPALCVEGEGKTKTELHGSFSMKEKGATKEVQGTCKVNATSQPFETIQVFCGTWNMDEKKPPSDPRELRKWIQPDKYDLYAICVQQSGYPKEKDKFLGYIQSVLGRDYIALASSTLWGLQLVVLSKKKHGMKISNVGGEMKATGYMHVCGNRGSVGISLTFNETNMSFLCSHMMQNSGPETPDSSTDNTKMRNKNYQETVSGLKMGNKTLDIFAQNHYVFWMGDLNYRVELPFSKAVELAQRKDCKELLKHDQLNKERDGGRAFVGFKEAPITFPPTYKYRKGKDEYRMSKKRTPSFCDRILYKAWPGCAIANTAYSDADIRISDHRPVYAGFKINTVRPFASIFAPVENRCDIIFEEVRLVGNEKKIVKPSLSFYCKWVEHLPVADKIPGKTASPVWGAKSLPLIVPNTPHRDYLKVQHLVMVVRDGAQKIGETFNNLVGSGVLHLKAIVQSSPDAVEFKIPIYGHGLETGYLEGRVKIVYSNEPLVAK